MFKKILNKFLKITINGNAKLCILSGGDITPKVVKIGFCSGGNHLRYYNIMVYGSPTLSPTQQNFYSLVFNFSC